MPETEELVSIEAAARRVGVSRRTIERWIREGRLAATPSEVDRRVRLVNATEAAALAQPAGRRTTVATSAPSEARDVDVDESEQTASPPAQSAGDSGPVDDYQLVIDQALQLTYTHIHRTVHQVCPAMFKRQSLEALRSGPLGSDLRRLAQIARGEVKERPELVLTAIESIMQLLFWPAAADDYSVPRSFWDTDLGRMLALAKFRAFEPSDLVTIGNTAERLGVTRSTVYRWIEDRTLNSVLDDMTGRTFVVRRDVDRLIRHVHRMAGQRPLPGFEDDPDDTPPPDATELADEES